MVKTEIQQFRISTLQKKTLKVLHKKYKINTSNFIRDAIQEKLERERHCLLKEYKELQNYLKISSEYPF
jgi:hypothetical protein